jgi:hypothetical protein
MFSQKHGIFFFGVSALLLLLIAVGSFSLIKKVDSNYSSIVSSEVKLQKAVHQLERDFNDMQRSMLNMLLITDSVEIGKIRLEALDAAKRMDKHIDNLEPLRSTQHGRDLLIRLTLHSLQYRQICASFIVLVDAKENRAAVAFNKKDLFPALSGLQKDQEEIVDYIGSITIKNSDKISSSITKFGSFTVGISTLPATLWIIGCVTILTFIFLSLFPKKERLL